MKKHKSLTKNQFILLLILVVSIFKLGLINKGFSAFLDEGRYNASGQILKSLYQQDVHSAIRYLFSTQGRPGDTLIKTLPTAVQCATAYLLGYEIYETNNSFPLFFFNFAIYCLILILHYKVSLYFLKDQFLSLFSVLLYSSLVASYISLRHADPYDGSLLILYYVFYKILKNYSSNHYNYKALAGLGFLAFFGFSCYPGYISLYMIIPGYLLLNSINTKNMVNGVRKIILFGSGSVLCLVLYEVTARISGTSFLNDSRQLSSTITQGSFEESFSFIVKYLYEVENINGILLLTGLLLFIVSLFYTMKQIKTHFLPDIYLLFILTFLLYMGYAAMGYYFHKVVFYARLIKQFLPFMTIFTVFALLQLYVYLNFQDRNRYNIIYILSAVLLVNFSITFKEYMVISYPKDMAWNFYNKFHLRQTIDSYEYKGSYHTRPDLGVLKKKNIPKGHKAIVFVNFCDFYPFNNMTKYNPYKNSRKYQLFISEPSCIKFKAYQFEAFDIQARKNLDKINLQTKIYIEQ